MRSVVLLALGLPSRGFYVTPTHQLFQSPMRALSNLLRTQVGPVMAVDYNNPVVAAEYERLQELPREDIVKQLDDQGIPTSNDMSDMDVILMLLEMNVRNTGDTTDSESKKRKKEKAPANANAFEKALYEKPAFKALYDKWVAEGKGRFEGNCAADYMLDPKGAKGRYADQPVLWKTTVEAVEAALNAKEELTSPKISYDGFPTSMGDEGVKATLEAIGEIKDFTCTESSDGMTFSGTVEFGDVAMAQAAMEQYDGMDMGTGDKLDISPL